MLSIVNSGAAIGIIPEGMVNLQMFPQLQIFDFIRPEKNLYRSCQISQT